MKIQKIKEAITLANGDVKKATDALVSMALKDHELMQEIVADSLRSLCYELICYNVRQDRSKTWNMPTSNQSSSCRDRILAHAEGLMMLQLPGGKYLRDATRQDLLDAAEFYDKQARDMASKANFFRTVANQLHGKKQVKTSLTESKLLQIKARIDKNYPAAA